MENNNFDRFLDKDRIETCNLDLDLFQFESQLDKRKCEKFIPKNIHELSIIKCQPIKLPYGTKLDSYIKER